jgi:hypothetical protein
LARYFGLRWMVNNQSGGRAVDSKPWDMRRERSLAGFHTNVTELKYLPSGRETGNGGETQWIGQQG